MGVESCERIKFRSIYNYTYIYMCVCVYVCVQSHKIGKIKTGSKYVLLLSFIVISDVYGSFIPNLC